MPWERDVDARGKVGSTSVRRVADGNWAPNRATRDGSLYTADWIQACIIEGKGHTAGIGLLSAGEALQNLVITTLRPTLWIDVPQNTTIMPIYAGVQVEDSGATGAFEIALGAGDIVAGAGTSSDADFGPVNMVSRLGVGKCTAYQESTATVIAGSDPVSDLWRIFMSEDNVTTPATVGKSHFEYEPYPRCPILVGPAVLVLSIGSSAAPTCTAQLQWLEFDTDEIR